jgi:hypothetical protein
MCLTTHGSSSSAFQWLLLSCSHPICVSSSFHPFTPRSWDGSMKKTRPAFVPNCLLVLPSSQILILHLIELDGPGAVGGFRLIRPPPPFLSSSFHITHKLTGGRHFDRLLAHAFCIGNNWKSGLRVRLPVDVIQLAWRGVAFGSLNFVTRNNNTKRIRRALTRENTGWRTSDVSFFFSNNNNCCCALRNIWTDFVLHAQHPQSRHEQVAGWTNRARRLYIRTQERYDNDWSFFSSGESD